MINYIIDVNNQEVDILKKKVDIRGRAIIFKKLLIINFSFQMKAKMMDRVHLDICPSNKNNPY